MFLLEIDRGDVHLVQGFVRSSWPTIGAGGQGAVATWAALFAQSAALWSQLRPLSAALRVEAAPGQALASLHSFVVPRAETPRLRAVLAAFLRTDRIGNAQTSAPYAPDDLAGRFVHRGGYRAALERETMSTGRGYRIRHNLRLSDHLPAVVEAARGLGIEVSYEMQVARWSVPRSLLRDVLYDGSHLGASRSAPAQLADDQMQLGHRLKQAAFHVEEALASPSPEGRDAIGHILADIAARTVYGAFGAEPRVFSLTDRDAEPFACHVHSWIMDPGEGAAQAGNPADALTHADADWLLGCRGLGLDRALERGTPAPFAAQHRPLPPAGGPGPTGAPFLFVSYARDDAKHVYPIVDSIVESGIPLWIDRNIMGGDEWVAELEDRIVNCKGILAFLSPRFADSRYCRREVQFADALDKPIIPAQIEPATLSSGLNFILHGRQFVDAGDPAFRTSPLAAVAARTHTAAGN